jgi:hypothetical protein
MKIFNRYTGEVVREIPNLSEADLSVANLSEADLSVANLRGADLSGANLRGADLRGADLSGANLSRANLSRADLSVANLSGADLSVANLRGADLREADLREADLREADLREADLRGANLSRADLSGANLSDTDLKLLLSSRTITPEGELIVWKQLRSGLCRLLIPKEAARLGGLTGRKCRAEYAFVLDGAGASLHDPDFLYLEGKRVTPHSFCSDPLQECAGGIHFFLTREEAEAYR